MILKFLSYFLIGLSAYNSYQLYKKNPTLIKDVYLKNLRDYFYALLLVIFIISLVIGCAYMNLPKLLTFSWLNIFGSEGGNLISSGLNPGTGIILIPKILYSIITFTVFLILMLCLPYLAKSEEEIFRSGHFELRSRIKQSIKFGFAHMIVGVPVFIAIILSIVGFIFSERYVKSFNKKIHISDYGTSEDYGINQATSLHAKYNFIIILIALLAFI